VADARERQAFAEAAVESAKIDESGGDRARLALRIQRWFNDSMVRVSGWYRRWAQRTLFWTAIGLAVLLNANSVRMVRVLYDTPVLRELLVAEAKSRVEAERPAPETEATVESVKSEIATIQPILGWTAADFRPSPSWGKKPSAVAWLLLVIENLVGFFVTVLAISMGAPFWFDALQKLLRLRTQVAGDKGAPAAAGAAGADSPGFAAAESGETAEGTTMISGTIVRAGSTTGGAAR